MYATIQSEQFDKFYCSVKAEPIIQVEEYNVYELVDSIFPNDIIVKTKDGKEIIFRHIAINNQSNGYLFDFDLKKLYIDMGLCRYSKD